MDKKSSRGYKYHVGGIVPRQSRTYVTRQADEDLYNGIVAGEFCYVLSSRQMGKSSLRVNVMHRLKSDNRDNIACTAIDLSQIDPDVGDWYAGIIDEIATSLQLKSFDLNKWWEDNRHTPFSQRFSKFIGEVLLKEIKGNIVIFFDEIDSTQSLSFNSDYFFAAIRECYNRRADRPEYRRLTFVLLGVSTPSDLIKDRLRTPFNIGRSIDLAGFQLEEVRSSKLAQGLESVGDPQALILAILGWTGGQPFLTQKVCQIVQKSSPTPASSRLNPVILVENLVREKIIENWEIKDDPEHLRTIRDRLLADRESTGRILGLCQQILQQGEIATDDSPEQTQLPLTGLVVKRHGKLKIYNRVYAEVFNLKWVETELAKLRPYAEAIKAWVASHDKDESRLLRGEALEDALAWERGKSLSDEDRRFLRASEKFDRQEERRTLDAEIKRERILTAAQNRFKQTVGVSLAIFLTSLGTSAYLFVYQQARIALDRAIGFELKSASLESKVLWSSNDQIRALVASIKTGKKLLEPQVSSDMKPEMQQEILGNIQPPLIQIQELNRLESHTAQVRGISYSPDGSLLASVSFDRTVKLWKSDGTLLRTLPHNEAVYTVAFSPDGQIIASGSKDRTVKLWKNDGTFIKTLPGSDSIRCVRFSLDGQTIAAASDDGKILLWRSDGTFFKTWKAHPSMVNSLAFSPNGKTLASVGSDNKVKLWNSNGTLLKSLDSRSRQQIYGVNFSPDGREIAWTSDDNAIVAKSDGTMSKLLKGHTALVRDVIFSTDGEKIATISDDKTLKIWKRDGTLINTLMGHTNTIRGISFSRNGRIASASDDETIRIWSTKTILLKTLRFNDIVRKVSISPDGRVVGSVSDEGKINLWKFNGEKNQTLVHPKVRSLSFSPDGLKIVSSDSNGIVKLWSRNGALLKNLTGHKGTVYEVKFSPNGQTIASVSADKTINLWNSQGILLKTLTGHSNAVTSVDFSPDSKTIASGSEDKTINIWNINGDLLKTLNGHDDKVLGVSFSLDGKLLASASGDSTIKLWSWQNDRSKPLTLRSHRDRVRSVSFSPDGATLASASEDNTVKVWRKNGSLLKTLNGHGGKVRNISFSPDGKILASASNDKTVILWDLTERLDLPLDKLLSRGCQGLSDYLKTNPTLSDDDRQICNSLP